MLIVAGNYYIAGLGNWLSKISIGLYGILLLYVLIKTKVKVTKDVILVFAFVFLSWFSAFVWNNNDRKAGITIGVSILVKAFPYYYFTRKIQDWERAKLVLYKSAIVTTIEMTILTIFSMLSEKLFLNGMYNQFYGFLIAPSVIISFISFWENKSMIHLINFIVSGFLLFIFGARAPILCCAIAVALLFYQSSIGLKYKRHIGKKTIMIGSLCIILMIISFFIIDQKIKETANLSEFYGPGQRMLYQIKNGTFFSSSGRIEIYKNVIGLIKKYPITGTGLISDRKLIAEYLGNDTDYIGHYAHNIFLEFFLQYGIFEGGLLILYCIYITYISLTKPKNKHMFLICIYSISFGLGQLLVSGPSFEVKEFWIFLGMGMNVLMEKNHVRPLNSTMSDGIQIRMG